MHERGNTLVIVLVVAVMALIAFVAYQQGYLGGQHQSDGGGDVNIDLPGGNNGGY
jgi:hypothetical protein